MRNGHLHPETEGFILAIQDKVIRTKNYEKHILKVGIEDKCRKCNTIGETIEHITGGCALLAKDAYLGRHNSVAAIIHQRIASNSKLLGKITPYYKYEPASVLENGQFTLYWDRPIITDRHIKNHRPDIVLIDRVKKSGIIIDVAVPLTKNLITTENEKIEKYQDLVIELKRMWKLSKVEVIPVVISVDGVVSKRFKQFLQKASLPTGLYVPMQRSVILHTCRIVRKFLALG